MHKTLRFAILLMVAAALITPPAGAQIAPAIQIVSPRNGTTISGTMMVVEVRVQGVKLVPSMIGKPANPGQGHWEIFVDGKAAGLSADDVISLPNDVHPSLLPGKHTLKAVLYNNDNTAIDGADSSEVTVTIPAKSAMRYKPASGNPRIKILVPHNHATTSPYVIVWVKINGLRENPSAVGKPARAGEGHWHLYVDGKMAGLSTTNVADVQMSRGKHILKAMLTNNDNTPVKGAASDQIAVTVK
jgi:hypothetical protein